MKSRIIKILFEIFIVLAINLGVIFAFSAYLWSQAKPFIPSEGYVFPKELVLTGKYQNRVLPSSKFSSTLVGATDIFCNSFSYFSATRFGTGGDSDCGFEEELNGKLVEVHRVRIPTKNPEAEPVVVKIISLSEGGKIYLDLTDAEIREKYIRYTRQTTWLNNMAILLICFVMFFSFIFAVNLSDKLFKE